MPRTGAFFWSCLPAGLEDFCCASGPAAATCPPQPRLDRPADRCPAVPRRATGSRRSHGSNRRLACRPFGRCVHALTPLQVTKRARWACSVADSCRCGLDVARVWGPRRRRSVCSAVAAPDTRCVGGDRHHLSEWSQPTCVPPTDATSRRGVQAVTWLPHRRRQRFDRNETKSVPLMLCLSSV